MRAHGLDALPLLDKDEPQVILDIDMAMMPQAPRLPARPRAMRSAERDHTGAVFRGEDDMTSDEDHDVELPG